MVARGRKPYNHAEKEEVESSSFFPQLVSAVRQAKPQHDVREHNGRYGCWAIYVAACTTFACSALLPKTLSAAPTILSPLGCQVGQTATVTASSEGDALWCSHRGLNFRKQSATTFEVHVDRATPPGLYDVQALGDQGLAGVGCFFVTRHPILDEATLGDTRRIQLNSVVSGRIEKGEVDHFTFQAAAGDQLIIECWSDRIDSKLRAILELTGPQGERLAISRGFFGIDPAVTYAVPADGEYTIRLHDLVFAGGADYAYRLDVSDGPRVLFAVPPAVRPGEPAAVRLYGWNLGTATEKPTEIASREHVDIPMSSRAPLALQEAVVEVTAPAECEPPAVRRRPAECAVDSFSYYFPGADVPIALGLTDLPSIESAGSHRPELAQDLAIPSEAVGQLLASGDQHWYALEARRGEVLYIEAYGERIGAPVDLDLSLWDERQSQRLLRATDERTNLGGTRFPSSHLDPSARWVAPADGRYLLAIRSLIGSLTRDPRRVYRLSVRREEPVAELVSLAPGEGMTVARGGRARLDIFAFRRRGLQFPIRVEAHDLPDGVSADAVWLGPNVNTTTMVFSADESAAEQLAPLRLVSRWGELGSRREREVYGGTTLSATSPVGRGRLMAAQPIAVAGRAPLRVLAETDAVRDHHLYGKLDVQHAPGGVLDVSVHVERSDTDHSAPVRLLGVGLPPTVRNQSATIPASRDRGVISFYLPPSLPPGPYSFAIAAETTIPGSSEKPEDARAVSNSTSVVVHPPAFELDVDFSAPRKIRRGQVVQVGYTARRINGFIGKIHTELAAPGRVTDVGRLRGRGVTFVGQTESGMIQVIANEDADLGLLPFLRLYAVGVVEDQPIHHGSCFLNLEIVE